MTRGFFVFIFLTISCLTAHHANSQRQRILDSLYVALEGASDTNKVNLLNAISSQLRDKSHEKSLEYAKEARELSEKLNFPSQTQLSFANPTFLRKKSDFPSQIQLSFANPIGQLSFANATFLSQTQLFSLTITQLSFSRTQPSFAIQLSFAKNVFPS